MAGQQVVTVQSSDYVRIEERGGDRAVSMAGHAWLHEHDCHDAMLEACQAALEHLEYIDRADGETGDALRAAIALATPSASKEAGT